MTEKDVIFLDFKCLWKEIDRGNNDLTLRDARERGEELIYQTKGEGIIKLLNDLLVKKI